jgi:hypothetical protein
MNILGRQQAPLDHLREKPQRQGVAASEAALLTSPPSTPLCLLHIESSPMLVMIYFKFPFITCSRPHTPCCSRNVGMGEGRPSQAMKKGLTVTQRGTAEARLIHATTWIRILDLGAAVDVP